MRIGIFGKGYKEDHATFIKLLTDQLSMAGVVMVFHEHYLRSLDGLFGDEAAFETFSTYEDVREDMDILLSIGGDGTFLDTVPFVRDSGVPVLGINLGRLGFLSSVSKQEISEAVEFITSGNYTLEKRSLLHLDAPGHLFGELSFALNDITIYRNATPALIMVHVFVDDMFLNSYYGDGLIVATPTGSTAYSLSVGGPIITPGSENFIISPIASHNLTVRPIVIKDTSTIRLTIEGREEKYLMTMDSRQSTISKSDEIIISRSNFSINLIQLPNKNFYSTIRDKLLWGMDYRNQQTNYFSR